MNELKFEVKTNPDSEEQKIIRNGIIEFNESIIKDKHECFNIIVKNNENIIAGAIIYQHKDALYIDVIWCLEEYRKNGIGSKLMNMIEDEARNKSIKKLFVDTYAFQAQEFYKKHNFKVISVVPEYLAGYDRIFMRKDI